MAYYVPATRSRLAGSGSLDCPYIKEGEFVPSPTKLLPFWLAKAAVAPLRSLRSLQGG